MKPIVSHFHSWQSNSTGRCAQAITLAFFGTAASLAGCSGVPTTPSETTPSETQALAAAQIATGTVEDNYHGTLVADPYRWLEDDVRESASVATFVETQNARSSSYLGKLPGRSAIEERMTKLWNYARSSTPRKKGGRYWYSHNDGLANQSRVLAASIANTDGEVMLDPNRWSDDGTVALAGYWPDNSGRYVAYTIQDGGTDWRIAKVRDLRTGEDTTDELRWLKFTALAWAADGSGFYYSRYPEPDTSQQFQSTNLNKAVYFHTLGTAQVDDELVYEDPAHPERGFFPQLTTDGNFLVIVSSVGTDDRYEVFVEDLRTGATTTGAKNRSKRNIRKLVTGFEYDYTLIGNRGGTLYFRSNKSAPLGSVLAFDLDSPDQTQQGVVVIPESTATLQGGSLVDDTLVLNYLVDAASTVKLFDLEAETASTLELPGIGSVSGFPNNTDGAETFYSFSSMTTPPSTFRLDVATGKSTLVRQPELAFDPEDYQVQQTFYTSKDGTRVPLYIASKKTTALKNAPTLLYGYGGFNISLTPRFSVTQLAWMELGGVYAQANLRGGGEYGEAWHKAGTKLQKQNVFDDFIAAAQHLIQEGITTPARLGIHGRSNGGLLVGAVVNQRPELFGAALPGVGVMDMLRFHQFTAGRFWTDDYGSADNPEEFKALFAYSPYHNITAGKTYPPILVTTADTDDRVVPGHSFKYAARLQATDTGDAPALLRIETRSGHGEGKPTSKRIAEFADMWAFLAFHLDLKIDE